MLPRICDALLSSATSQAAWTFANLLEALAEQRAKASPSGPFTEKSEFAHPPRPVSVLLEHALRLATASSPPQTRINGLRAVGSAALLCDFDAASPAAVVTCLLAPLQDSKSVKVRNRALCLRRLLSTEGAQVQWNALTALTRVIVHCLPLDSAQCSTVLAALLRTLSTSPNLKVRCCVVQALAALYSAEDDGRVRVALDEAEARLAAEEPDLPFREQAHAQALRKAVRRRVLLQRGSRRCGTQIEASRARWRGAGRSS
jgi:hypothetical protein